MANGTGGASIWLTVLGIFLSVVTPLLGIIYWRQRSDITTLRAEVKALWIEATAFKAFQAFDTEREKNWERWRGQLEGERIALEGRLDRMRQESIDWKHDKYGPRMSRIELDLVRIRDKLGMSDRGDDK